MEKRRNKRVYAGYYIRHDGKWVYVVGVVKDIDTGEDIVICEEDSHTKKPGYFTMTKASFCEQVLRGGEYIDKYRRNVRYPNQ